MQIYRDLTTSRYPVTSFRWSKVLSFLGFGLITISASFPSYAETLANQSEWITEVTPAVKEIMSITSQGIEPRKLTLHKLDSSVFFYNASTSDLLSLKIDFGKRKIHCWSPNLHDNGDGVVRSLQPVGPKDFAITCFPDAGKYPVEIRGIGGSPKAVTAEIIVEP